MIQIVINQIRLSSDFFNFFFSSIGVLDYYYYSFIIILLSISLLII